MIWSSELAAARAAWLAALTAERGRSAATVTAYEKDTRQFLDFLAGHLGEPPCVLALAELTAADVRAFLAARRREGASARTVARALAALRTFCAALERTSGLEFPAVRAVTPPKARPRLPRPLSAAHAAAVTAHTTGSAHWVTLRDTAVLLLLYGAGLRISEALSLNARDVGDDTEFLRVVGKGDKERSVPLLPAVRQAIAAYRAAAPFAFADGALFRGERGGRLSPRIVQRTMADARRALGLPETATPHAMRHTFATVVLHNGGDLRAIQALLGHASLSTTQVYTAVEPAHLIETFRTAHPRA